MGTWYYNTPDHDTKRSKTDTLEAAYKWKEYEYNWKEANCAGGFCENFHQTGSYDKPNYLLKERHIVQNHTYMGWKKDAQESSLSSYPPPNKNDCPNQCWGT